MELKRLNFGKEPDVHVTVASRIYWCILPSENERRSLEKRDELVEYCALRIADELGEPVNGEKDRKKFLVSVRCVMDHIRRRDLRRQVERRSTGPDFLDGAFVDEDNSSIPQQLSLGF